MTEEQQLKVQAFLDGELPESDSREVAAWLARDADASALLGELKNTRNALKEFESPGTAGVPLALGEKLPESREFYWSKIKREIERAAPEAAPAPRVSLFTWFRRALMPLGTVAALGVVALVAIHSFFGSQHSIPMTASVMVGDPGAFTYRDDAQDITVVWLSYPAENKLAEKSPGDTLPAK
jgi:anti-sigma factor RsiW